MSIIDEQIPNPIEGWVTIDEAARVVGFTGPAVRYWADQGYITSYPVGQVARIVYLEQVKAFADERRKSRKLMKYAGKRLR